MPTDTDYVRLDKGQADAGGFEDQGSGVQAVVPVDSVRRSLAQIITAEIDGASGSDIDFRVSRP